MSTKDNLHRIIDQLSDAQLEALEHIVASMLADASSMTPTVFEAYVGGFTGDSYQVALTENGLIYRPYGYGAVPEPSVAVQPSPSDWQRFRQSVDKLAVWDWQADYQPDDLVMDGTGWEISLAWGGREVESTGSNAFPPGFDKWCKAVSRLVGGLPFA